MVKIELTLHYREEQGFLKDAVAQLLREHSDWLKEMDVKELGFTGKVVHKSGNTVKWTRDCKI